MNGYWAFVKKEFREMSRSYKLFIMAVLFFIIGVLNPVTARYTPEILEKVMPEGMLITITEPVAMDSWLQFFKNITQMGLIIFVIVYSGLMSNEFTKGTLINVLTKGLSRKDVIMAKFTAVGIVWTISYFFCFGVSYAYTQYFWEETVPNLLFAVACLWLYGLLLLACVLLGGVLFKSNYGALLFTAIIVGIQLVINIFPNLTKYNPLMLSSSNTLLLNKTLEVREFIPAVIITFALIVVALGTSIALFNKKKI